MMREPLLARNPELGPVTLAMLAGIATAIESESVERYSALAQIMEQRGEHKTAAAFRRMVEEERNHVEAVARWVAEVGEAAPDAAQFSWRLPADLSSSWEEVAGSARLTPYRAFALAVDNEQRAFALYSYLAASAVDAKVAAQAESLALEELRHAALMRSWRREAWHRERRETRSQPPAIATIEQLRMLLAEREAAIGERQRTIGLRLRALGDHASAEVVEQIAREPTWTPAGRTASAPRLPEQHNPVALLMAAQAPLEELSETLEIVMHRMEGELFAAAQHALENVIARIAGISLQAERRTHAADTASPGS